MTQPDDLYVLERLQRRLPSSEGQPMVRIIERDFSIVYDEQYFGTVATNIGLAQHPTLPGLEQDVSKKIRRGVAGARSSTSKHQIEQVRINTYAEDTCRSLFRVTKSGKFIPVDSDDTVDSFHARATDYIDEIFAVADIERIPVSAYRRGRGVTELRTRFEDRDPDTVLDLSILAGRNAARKRGFWLKQLDTTSQGLKKIPTSAVNEFSMYAASRPAEYLEKPDLISILAGMSRRPKKKVS